MRHPWRRSLSCGVHRGHVSPSPRLVSSATGPAPQAAGPPAGQGRAARCPTDDRRQVRGGAGSTAGRVPAGRSGDRPAPPGHSSLRFALASAGLPTGGIWKSSPALVDINGDGVPDLAALPRAGRGAPGLARPQGRDVGGSLARAPEGRLVRGRRRRGGPEQGWPPRPRRGRPLPWRLGLPGRWRGAVAPRRRGPETLSRAARRSRRPRRGQEEKSPGRRRSRGDRRCERGRGARPRRRRVLRGRIHRLPGRWLRASLEGGHGAGRLAERRRPRARRPGAGRLCPQVLLTDMDGDGHLDVVASLLQGPSGLAGRRQGTVAARLDGAADCCASVVSTSGSPSAT